MRYMFPVALVLLSVASAVFAVAFYQSARNDPLRMQGASAQPPLAPYTVHEGVLFREGLPPLPLDIVVPPRPNRTPVLVVQSGAWRPRPCDLRESARPLLEAGYVVFGIRHRETSSDTIYDLVRDIVGAAAFVDARAGDYGADPNRLILFGHSAGAHLALLAARRAHAAGVVAWAPLTDLRGWNAPEGVRFSGSSDPAVSPICDPDGLPRVLIVHGTADECVPVEQSRAFAKATGCELVEVPGGGHYTLAGQAWALTLDWLAELR